MDEATKAERNDAKTAKRNDRLRARQEMHGDRKTTVSRGQALMAAASSSARDATVEQVLSRAEEFLQWIERE